MLDLVVLGSDKTPFKGHCWPGTSYYADFLNPKIEDVWKYFFKNENYFLNFNNIHTWIDMNEPSVFEQSEITMPKNNMYIIL